LFVLSGRHQFYLALLMVVLETAATIGWNFTLVRMIDSVSSGQMAGFYNALWLTLGLFLVGIPLNFLRVRSVGQFSERTMAYLREKIATQATRLPMRYLEERHSGDLMSVVNADLGKLKNLTANTLVDVLRQSLLAVSALVALFVLSWQLALASTLFIPFVMVVMSNLSQPIAKRTQEMQQAVGETVSVAQDGLGGLMVTRAFNLTAVMDERFRSANQSALGKACRWRAQQF
jgi:ABC-type multidrug transport system fused ATPase/permease subunit